MESFTVQCTSCQSRIRVRNPNMIGQIANCPKCGSMILIAAPQKITVESGNPTDSLAVTREALPPPDAAALQAAPETEDVFGRRGPPPVESLLDTAAAGGQSLPGESLNAGESSYEEALPADPLAADFAADENLFENLSPSAWMPEPVAPPKEDEVTASINAVRAKRLEAAGRSKQVMLIVGIGSLSVLVALGILFVFLNWFAKSEQKTVANNKPAVVDPGKPDPGRGPVDDASAPLPTPPAASDMPSEDSSKGASGDATSGPVEQGSDDVPTANSEGTALPAASSDPSVKASTSEPAATVPDVTAAPATPPKANVPGVPLGSSIAPNLDDVLGGPASGRGDGPGDDRKGSAQLPPGLQNFANLFGPSIEPVLPDASVPLAKAPDVPDNAPKPAPADAAPVDNLPSIVEKRLGLQLSGLLIDKRPLSEALCTLGLIGDMPVMADLDSILAGGLPRNPQIEFKSATATKLGDVFNSLEKDTGIAFVPWENKVLIARASDELLEKRIPEALAIDDLVSDAQQADALLQAIKEVVPEVAECSLADGHLQLKLNSDNRIVWFQVARLLESWRVARGIKNEQTSALVPAKSLLPGWPVPAIEPYAQVKIKQTLSSKEPMVRTWQRFTFEAKVACWVDWYSLAAAKISPADSAMVINQNRTLGDLLQHYARVYRIVFAIEDGRNLWVTTSEAHRVQSRLYLLPLGGKTAEAWAEELQELAPLNPTTGENMLKLVPTPDGQYLFARACRPLL